MDKPKLKMSLFFILQYLIIDYLLVFNCSLIKYSTIRHDLFMAISAGLDLEPVSGWAPVCGLPLQVNMSALALLYINSANQ